MIVAVIAVGVVHVIAHDVIDVIVVLDDPMTAAGAMDVSGVVCGASVSSCVAASGTVRVAHVLLYARARKTISRRKCATYPDKTLRAMTMRCTSLVPS